MEINGSSSKESLAGVILFFWNCKVKQRICLFSIERTIQGIPEERKEWNLMAIWDDVIPAEDLTMFKKGGMGGSGAYGKRPAIVVVDMTYGFVDDAYPMGSSKMGWPTVRAIRRLLEKGREKGLPIFFTRISTGRTPTERGHWKYLKNRYDKKVIDPKEHQAIWDAKENQIVEELRPRTDEVVIDKFFPSAFFGTTLSSMLAFHNVDTLIVTGMVTSGCVRATAVDAFSYSYLVIVPEECVGDRGAVSHKVSLFDIHMKYGDVVPLSETMNYLNDLGKEGV
jgi:maleamate amidohydrolase